MGSLSSEYGISLPTKDRSDMLAACVDSLINQTIPPSLIVIINHNSKDRLENIFNIIKNTESKTEIIVENNYGLKSPDMGHAIGLDHFVDRGLKIGGRWDDDLIPNHDCMEYLLKHIQNGYSAAGGCYPRPNAPIWKNGPYSYVDPPDGFKNHIQFFRWTDDDKFPDPYECKWLYSGFLYDIEKLVSVGGICVDYSTIAFRAETDMSLRLRECIIEPKAIATHHVTSGGTRGWNPSIRNSMIYHDTVLFKKRMKEYNIILPEGF